MLALSHINKVLDKSVPLKYGIYIFCIQSLIIFFVAQALLFTLITTQPLLTSFNTRSTYINLSKDKKRNDLADSIIMKKMGASSLKMEIDILQDLKTQPNYRKIKSIKKENIFDKNFIRNDKLRYTKSKKDNPFIALNKKILTDVNFGNAIEQKNIVPEKEKVVVSKHLSMQEAIKEIGYTMISGIKIKFPRNRRVELSK